MALKDISYTMIDGIFDTLNANVTVSGTTYAVYKTIPVSPAVTYVKIGEVIEGPEQGTNDNFMYYGSVSISVVDHSLNKQGDKKLAQSICNKIRSLLKTSKGSNPTITGLVVFELNGKTESVSISENDIPEVRITDIYNFIIE